MENISIDHQNHCQHYQISLKKLTRENLEDFYAWASDPEVTQFMTWEAYTNKNDALDFLINIAEPHPYFKAIYYNGKVVGSITLTPKNINNVAQAELGYVLAKGYWGRGIATAAVIKVIESGFRDLKIDRIEASVDPDNISSRRVLEKAGMTCEGLLKNHIMFKGQIRDRYIYYKSS